MYLAIQTFGHLAFGHSATRTSAGDVKLRCNAALHLRIDARIAVAAAFLEDCIYLHDIDNI